MNSHRLLSELRHIKHLLLTAIALLFLTCLIALVHWGSDEWRVYKVKQEIREFGASELRWGE